MLAGCGLVLLCCIGRFFTGRAYGTYSRLVPLEQPGIPVAEGADDRVVIPDRYNTGVTDETRLFTVTEPGTYGGVSYVRYHADDRLKVDVSSLMKKQDSVVIEDMDFSGFQLNFVNEETDGEKTITFRNCRFASFQCGQPQAQIHYEFENCAFQRFYGSNAHMTRCSFGGSYKDGINPFVNVTVENCFFSDMSHFLESGSAHTDGVQVFGKEGVDVHDIVIRNCRFEIPPIPRTGSKAYVNACLFLCMEFSNGDGITVDNCILNGGGYCIYTNAKEPYTLKNVTLTNLRVGEAHRYGIGFQNIVPQTAQYSNIEYLDRLYAASVWKDEAGTHVSVSNDTGRERILRVQTGRGSTDYVIPACPAYDDVEPDTIEYADYPFDIDIVTGEDADWLICYDVTDGEKKQIRFVNWTGQDVTLEADSFACAKQ